MKGNSRRAQCCVSPQPRDGFAHLNIVLQKQPLSCFAGLCTSGGHQPIWGWREPSLPLLCVLGLILYLCKSATGFAPMQWKSSEPRNRLWG